MKWDSYTVKFLGRILAGHKGLSCEVLDNDRLLTPFGDGMVHGIRVILEAIGFIKWTGTKDNWCGCEITEQGEEWFWANQLPAYVEIRAIDAETSEIRS